MEPLHTVTDMLRRRPRASAPLRSLCHFIRAICSLARDAVSARVRARAPADRLKRAETESSGRAARRGLLRRVIQLQIDTLHHKLEQSRSMSHQSGAGGEGAAEELPSTRRVGRRRGDDAIGRLGHRGSRAVGERGEGEER